MKIGLLIFLVSCISKKNVKCESIVLQYNTGQAAVYDLYFNVNVALDMGQPVNLNMDLFSTVVFKKVNYGIEFSSVSRITRVKSIANSSIFHRSYDSDNPLLENATERQMKGQFPRVLNLDFTSKQNIFWGN